MATLILPARSDVAFYDFEVDLEGRSYVFELRWNARAGLWFLTLRDAAGEVIVANRAVVLASRLTGGSADPRLPPGTIVAVDTGIENKDPGREDLGGRVLLVYAESTGA